MPGEYPGPSDGAERCTWPCAARQQHRWRAGSEDKVTRYLSWAFSYFFPGGKIKQGFKLGFGPSL